MKMLRLGLILLFGAVCAAGGFLGRELTTLYSSIRLAWEPDGAVSGLIPKHFGNRDNRAIAAAICHGDHLVAEYEENITVAGGADFVRFKCAR